MGNAVVSPRHNVSPWVPADTARLAARLRTVPDLEVRENEPLERYTSFRIGGAADCLVMPGSTESLVQALRIAREEGCPVTVLGGGSNLLIADEGVRGMAVRIGRRLNRIAWRGDEVDVQAGASLPALAKQALQRSLSGLEFAAGIPGTVGGAIVMNAGAHDGDMARLVRRVEAVHRDGAVVTFDAEACRFRYRGSRFLDEDDWIITGAVLQLTPGEPAAIKEKMDAYLGRRRRTQPLGSRNAGSIFKNPPGDYAGRLIEAAGCKGWREGRAEVSTVHANFIVNRGEASAADVLKLIQRVRGAVQERFGVSLELEVGLIGFVDRAKGIGV